MKELVLRKVIEMVCDDYIDVLLVGIEEYKKEFPYTLACANFISELKEKNIIVEFNDVFIDTVRDRIYRETSNYLAR
ncbi:MAG: hypothetical protein HFG40_01860 [Bacilli bacterium]|nr:hypothetical protein [Bacilli bacterium]